MNGRIYLFNLYFGMRAVVTPVKRTYDEREEKRPAIDRRERRR